MWDDFGDGIDADDWAIILPLSEDLAEERKQRDEIIRDMERDQYDDDQGE